VSPALAVALAVTTFGVSVGASAPPGDPAPPVDPVVAALSAAGVAIVGEDALSGAGDVAWTVPEWQVAVWSAEVANGGGMTGAALRERFPVEAGQVPLDAVIATWLIGWTTPAAAAARTLVDTTPLLDPETADPAAFVYPWALLQLFGHDVVSAPDGEVADITAPVVAPSSASGLRRPAGSDPCAALHGIYDATIGKISAWAQSSSGDGALLSLAKGAVSLFGKVLAGVVETALSPITGPIKTAIAALSVAASVAGALSPWTATVVAEPPSNLFGVAPAPGNTGSFTVHVQTAIPDWPAPVKSCAALSGVDLPDITPAGSDVEIVFNGGIAATAQGTGDDGRVHTQLAGGDGEATARVDYVTSVESAEVAGGPEIVETISISGRVTHKGADQLAPVLTQMIGSALGSLPGSVVQLIAGTATDALTGLLALGDVFPVSEPVPVIHHGPPQPTTLPPMPGEPAATEPPGCVGRPLVSVASMFADGTQMPDGAVMLLNADGTGSIDFGPSTEYAVEGGTAAISGIMTFTWSGDGQSMTGANPGGDVTVAVNTQGVLVVLGIDVAVIMQGTESMSCVDGRLTFTRTGWTLR